MTIYDDEENDELLSDYMNYRDEEEPEDGCTDEDWLESEDDPDIINNFDDEDIEIEDEYDDDFEEDDETWYNEDEDDDDDFDDDD